MVKIKFDQVLTDLEGQPIKEPPKKDREGKIIKEKKPAADLTLKSVCINALFISTEQKISGEEKFKRYKLAEKINVGGEISLKVEEVALLKELIGGLYWPLVLGQSWIMLEKDKPEEKTEA